MSDHDHDIPEPCDAHDGVHNCAMDAGHSGKHQFPMQTPPVTVKNAPVYDGTPLPGNAPVYVPPVEKKGRGSR